MARRGDADPLVLQAVSERLARLLAEAPPRSAEASASPARTVPPLAAEAPISPATDLPDTELLDPGEVPALRRFSRLHLAVVSLLLLAALLWAGWSILRARPVAVATPVSLPAATPASPLPSVGSPSPSSTGSAAGTPAPPARSVVVHVTGAVRRPGLVTLDGPARVQDAIEAAGGLTREADAGELNLAQVLADGQQVVIGTRRRPAGEVRGASGAAENPPASGGPGGSSGASGSGAAAVDLNQATAAELDELPGVGPVTATKILAWRQQHGRFTRVEELQEVEGIGPKTYAEIAPHVRV